MDYSCDGNRDNKSDVIVIYTTDQGNTSTLLTYFSNGDGTFRVGPSNAVTMPNAYNLLTGDFNGDGAIDVATVDYGPISTNFEIFAGDGTGKFTGTFSDSAGTSSLIVADVNGDHRSDLLGSAPGGSVPYLTVFYGQSNGTLTRAEIPTNGCVTAATVADFNGDSIPDIAVEDNHSCSANAGPTTQSETVDILTGKGSGQFNSGVSVYGPALFGDTLLYTLRGNRDTKPDLLFATYEKSGYPTGTVTLLNTTSGNFPTCAPPNAAVGINVCSPAGASTSSPVSFAVGAAGDTLMRDVEVWVDGKKAGQQLTGAFSYYSFLNTSVPMSSGSHKVTLYGVGWDGSLQKKTFTLDVSPSTCSAPTSAGVHICSPVSGSIISSPVQILATGKVTGTLTKMNLWVDGVDKYSTTNSTLNTSIALTAGSHRFAVLAENANGQKWEAVSNATVR